MFMKINFNNNSVVFISILACAGSVLCSCNNETGGVLGAKFLKGSWANEEKPRNIPSECLNYSYETDYRKYILSDSDYFFYHSRNSRHIMRSIRDTPNGKKCLVTPSRILVNLIAKDSGQWNVEGQWVYFTTKNGENRKYFALMRISAYPAPYFGANRQVISGPAPSVSERSDASLRKIAWVPV